MGTTDGDDPVVDSRRTWTGALVDDRGQVIGAVVHQPPVVADDDQMPGTAALIGLEVVDGRGRRLGRIVGIVRSGSRPAAALVSPRLWLLRRARMVPIGGARIENGRMELGRRVAEPSPRTP